MQPWQIDGFNMYAKRIPAQINLKASFNESKKTKTTSKKYVIALDRQGIQVSSIDISQRLGNIQQQTSHIVFLIGEADGLKKEDIDNADACWSLSSLTFPHQLTKIILIEQLYRAFSILSGHPYHR